jgi:hypothetical protein
MSEARSLDRVEVLICGPGHHERTSRARPVVAAIAALGLEVAVSTDLRPRLADDVRSLLDGGASMVRLQADGIVGDLVSAAGERVGDLVSAVGEIPAGVVVVVLRAGPRVEPEVRGEGAVADSVRDAITDLTEADGEPG